MNWLDVLTSKAGLAVIGSLALLFGGYMLRPKVDRSGDKVLEDEAERVTDEIEKIERRGPPTTDAERRDRARAIVDRVRAKRRDG